jgi:hypothetical protein
MAKLHPRLANAGVASFILVALFLAASPARADSCPPTSATVGAGKGNSAGNPASEQGVEHSAILPDAGGEDSAAPTVKKDGQEVDATECPKPPNQLKDGGKVR